jgi:hypothetical protein
MGRAVVEEEIDKALEVAIPGLQASGSPCFHARKTMFSPRTEAQAAVADPGRVRGALSAN